MRKKAIIILSIIVAIPLLYIIYKSVKFQNIYDEIYYDSRGATGEIFSRRSTLGNIKGISRSKTSWVHEGDEVIVTESYETKYLPSTMHSLNITNDDVDKTLFIYNSYEINYFVTICLKNNYDPKQKLLKKGIYFIDSRQEGIIDNPKKVKTLIDKYYISKEQLDYWYELGMTKTLLEDWCSVYPSRFSPEKLGHVKIETQWADYK
ncbi:TipC family immunity protein [Xylocopilactobacillus apicola]|uniref:TipC family immunity protein n=1 Tax=Xylocopilactobacillus apicola TaxID=2932184 RepID=A0AAU9D3K3_9LACO|nr:TipC family immunity protein [Xylocopilactobacillus apicola]BDR59406.1 hypothetical protein XA3_18470 [Xylocopilactobacillus apicola]